MNTQAVNDLCVRAQKLAEALKHAYCTVEHLLAVEYSSNQAVWSDVSRFVIEKTPQLKTNEFMQPTAGMARVLSRMVDGKNLLAAIQEEGDKSHAYFYLKKHQLLSKK
jgi:Clp amino terminal domain, pathogenicity island component